MTEFICPHCGTTHEGHPTDWGWTLPDEVWDIPESERVNQAKYDSDRCEWGGRYFIRSVLQIPFTDREGYFGWGVWVEVAKNGFEAYLNVYDSDGSNEPRVPGVLANQIPGYPDLKNCAVEIQFGPDDKRPRVFCVDTSSCTLAAEQHKGIDSARYHQILESIGAV